MSIKPFSLIELFVGIFVFLPIITLIHESGHLFFNRLFGGRPNKVVLGAGKKLFSIGILEVKRYFFMLGYCTHSDTECKALRIVELAGGVLFQLLTCLLINMLVDLRIIKHSSWYDVFISLTLYIALSAMIPIKYHNIDSDGMQIYKVLRYGKSQFRNQEEQINGKTD